VNADLQVNINPVPASRRADVEELVGLVAPLAGQDLLGLTLYGSIASPDFDAGSEQITSIAVLERLRLDMLHALSEHGPRLARHGIAAPMFTTAAEIARSLDTFPLEFLEVRQFHIPLMGRDHFSSIEIHREPLRLQIERTFTHMLLDMRLGLLHATGRDPALSAIVEVIADRLLRTLRGLLWLKGITDSLPQARVLSEVQRMAGGDLPGLREAATLKTSHDFDEFKALYADLERLAKLSDEIR